MAVAGERVRQAAVDAALTDLERALCRDRCHAVLCAPAGASSELLLRALAPRLSSSLRVVELPAAEDADALFSALLERLGEPPGLDAEAALIGVARRLAGQGSALALVASDARALPVATLRRLGRLAVLSRPGLRLVLCAVSETGGERDAIAEIMAPLGIGAVKVVLDAPSERAVAPVAATPAAPRPAAVATAAVRPVAAAPAPARSATPRPHDAALPAIRIGARHLFARRAGWGALALLTLALVGTALYRLDESATAPGVATHAAVARRAEPPAPAPAAVAVAESERVPTPSPAPQPKPAAPPPAPRRAPAPAGPPAPESLRAPVVASLPMALASAERPAAATAATTLPEPAPAPPITPALVPVALAAEPIPRPADPVPAQAAPVTPLIELLPAQPALAAADAPAEERVRVSVNADPWARIQVDGREIGVTPMSDLELAPGTHRFRVRFPDGRVIERSVRIDALRDHVHFP